MKLYKDIVWHGKVLDIDKGSLLSIDNPIRLKMVFMDVDHLKTIDEITEQ
jgi:hypothetical protein